MILSREGGSEKVLGLVNATVGVTTLLGSIVSFLVKAPKSRVRVICNCLLFSMGFENFLLTRMFGEGKGSGGSTVVLCTGVLRYWCMPVF